MNGGGVEGVAAIYNLNPNANNIVRVDNSVIRDYQTGVVNKECKDDQFLIITSLHLTNSLIAGASTKTGINNICGHVVVNASTFQDIAGPAVIVKTNHASKLDTELNGVPQPTVYHPQTPSQVEIRNSTFTGITPGPGQSVISLVTETNPDNPAQVPVTDTELLLQHNTFAGNNLDSTGSEVSVTDGTTLKSLTIQNNAMQGSPLKGNFDSSTTPKVSHNLTTVPYTGPAPFSSAFPSVPDFKLGPLQDNGGIAPIGNSGSFGNILTMRPLAGSPLIDGAPSAGLDSDQRDHHRSEMGWFDIGAVEVLEAEFTADGGVWNGGTTPQNPQDPQAPGQLAETGADWRLGLIGAGLAVVLPGLVVLRKKF